MFMCNTETKLKLWEVESPCQLKATIRVLKNSDSSCLEQLKHLHFPTDLKLAKDSDFVQVMYFFETFFTNLEKLFKLNIIFEILRLKYENLFQCIGLLMRHSPFLKQISFHGATYVKLPYWLTDIAFSCGMEIYQHSAVEEEEEKRYHRYMKALKEDESDDQAMEEEDDLPNLP
jgi:hypothetical protein